MSWACMMTRISSRICCPALPPRPIVAKVQRIHMRQRGCAFHNSAMRLVIWFVVPASILGCVHVFLSHVKMRWKEKRCHTKIQLQKPSLLAWMSASSGTSKTGKDGMRDQTASRESTCTSVFQERIFRMCMPWDCFSHEFTNSRQFSYLRFKDMFSHVTSCSTILSATCAHSPFQRPTEVNLALALPPLLGLIHSSPEAVFKTKPMPAMAGSTTSSPPESAFFKVAGIVKLSPCRPSSPIRFICTWQAFLSTDVTPSGHSTIFCSSGETHSPDIAEASTPKCKVHSPRRGCKRARISTLARVPLSVDMQDTSTSPQSRSSSKEEKEMSARISRSRRAETKAARLASASASAALRRLSSSCFKRSHSGWRGSSRRKSMLPSLIQRLQAPSCNTNTKFVSTFPAGISMSASLAFMSMVVSAIRFENFQAPSAPAQPYCTDMSACVPTRTCTLHSASVAEAMATSSMPPADHSLKRQASTCSAMASWTYLENLTELARSTRGCGSNCAAAAAGAGSCGTSDLSNSGSSMAKSRPPSSFNQWFVDASCSTNIMYFKHWSAVKDKVPSLTLPSTRAKGIRIDERQRRSGPAGPYCSTRSPSELTRALMLMEPPTSVASTATSTPLQLQTLCFALGSASRAFFTRVLNTFWPLIFNKFTMKLSLPFLSHSFGFLCNTNWKPLMPQSPLISTLTFLQPSASDLGNSAWLAPWTWADAGVVLTWSSVGSAHSSTRVLPTPQCKTSSPSPKPSAMTSSTAQPAASSGSAITSTDTAWPPAAPIIATLCPGRALGRVPGVARAGRGPPRRPRCSET
mmetsp:Transcript_22052/g.63063  ORF Transcript_22052/g.63063 Transcript_22052/m.63063 type:complete len:806 (-) Transcript_22052:2-2419(-)